MPSAPLWQKLFPKYGNWGGPGWSGGRYINGPLDPETAAVGYIDSLDYIFWCHDGLYRRALWLFNNKRIDSQQFSAAISKADRWLLKKLKAMPADPRKWWEPATDWRYAWAYRKAAILAFTVKPALHLPFL